MVRRRRTRCLGSSPLARGKRKGRRRPSSTPWAHPRSRGENSGCCGPPHVPRGSSPLARGKQSNVRDGHRLPRLIPARAGKTPSIRCTVNPFSAHPRSRGENTRRLIVSPRPSGSSPLARGKLRAVDGRAGSVGLIPARAGKTGYDAQWRVVRAAHPRSRGENFSGLPVVWSETGSSPLARGKPA